jgi:serine/threonine-protein kinase
MDLVTGTPLYLSPEAITAADRLDGRADLYALGAVGYFLLAGRNVFEGATVVDVCAHHLHSVPEPPSRRLERPLPADLERVLLDCLAKQPERRPQTAAELVERLEACASAAEWGEREARAWWKQHAARVAQARAPRLAPSAPRALDVSLVDRRPTAGLP